MNPLIWMTKIILKKEKLHTEKKNPTIARTIIKKKKKKKKKKKNQKAKDQKKSNK